MSAKSYHPFPLLYFFPLDKYCLLESTGLIDNMSLNHKKCRTLQVDVATRVECHIVCTFNKTYMCRWLMLTDTKTHQLPSGQILMMFPWLWIFASALACNFFRTDLLWIYINIGIESHFGRYYLDTSEKIEEKTLKSFIFSRPRYTLLWYGERQCKNQQVKK